MVIFTFGFTRSWSASTPPTSMNNVPVAPIGLPAKAGYSLMAAAASLKKHKRGTGGMGGIRMEREA